MSGGASDGPERPAVIYLARGADRNSSALFRRFMYSYRRHRAGVPHDLFIIFKGFEDARHLAEGRGIFRSVDYQPLFTSDDSFDLGAYLDAARMLQHGTVCFLNSHSEIVDSGWLSKLSANFSAPYVGLVGATGSYESLPTFPSFPNPHIRSNVFMIDRRLFLGLFDGVQLTSKKAALLFESGQNSMTQQVFERGLTAQIVGRDGRGYTPAWWPHSQTFRQGSQSNLLVHDNVTRTFENLPFGEKIQISRRSWGEFIRSDKHL
jgi:hypothetical protein